MKILIIGGRVDSVQTANASIRQSIAKKLVEMGHRVTFIAINQDINTPDQAEFETHTVRSTLHWRLLTKKKEMALSSKEKILWRFVKIFRNIRNVFFSPLYPNTDPSQSVKAYKIARNLYHTEKYDAIIAMFRPFSALSALIKIKKKMPNVICGAYYLDVCTELQKPQAMPRWLYKILWHRAEKKVFEKSDFIILPKNAQFHFESDQYAKYKEKFEFCEFPAFVEPHLDENKCYSCPPNQLKIVFAGTLSPVFRNPEYILRVLGEVSKNIPDISLHIYGRGDCSKILEKYKSVVNILFHGAVEQRIVMNAYTQADYVLNISNSFSNMVPSKIFELFATGKPIINVVKTTEDTSVKYFAKYPSVCYVNEWKEIGSQIEEVERFLKKEKGKYYDPVKFSKEFYEHTPQYIAKVIERRINNSRNTYEI